jgi:hypothetical protein
LPDALGPMMPRPFPADSAKLTSWTIAFWSPGATIEIASTESLLTGGCSRVGADRCGMVCSSWLSRCQLCRAATKLFQCAIARSTGASARALRIEPAMMMPAVASWWITR